MEYIEGRSLQEIINEEGYFEEKRIREWALKLCDILCYLHSLEEPVVYRDLKPPHVFRKIRHYDRKCSFAMEALISQCLQPQPDKRFASAREMYDELVGLDKAELSIRRKMRIHGGLIIAGVAAVVLVLSLVFLRLREIRTQNIERYYALIDEARQDTENGLYEDAEKALDEAIRLEDKSEDAYIRKMDIYCKGRIPEMLCLCE